MWAIEGFYDMAVGTEMVVWTAVACNSGKVRRDFRGTAVAGVELLVLRG